MKRYATLLSVAGSDPSGGAGLQADIKTATSLGVYAMTAIPALTVQNTLGVKHSGPVPASLFRQQLECLLDDIRPDAVKISMLPTSEHVEILAMEIRRRNLCNIVIDPVAISTSGLPLTPPDAFEDVVEMLFPLASLVTPNLPEWNAVCRLGRRNVTAKVPVLLKGGHSGEETITDKLIFPDGREIKFSHRRVETPNTHGTGCVLSGATACFLSKGLPLEDAVAKAEDYLAESMEAGKNFRLGHGHGPLFLFPRIFLKNERDCQ